MLGVIERWEEEFKDHRAFKHKKKAMYNVCKLVLY